VTVLRKYGKFLKNLLVLLDLSLLAIAWFGAYLLSAAAGFMPEEQLRGNVNNYVLWIVPIWGVWVGVFQAFDLYRPRRISSSASEVWDITKACTLTILSVSTLSFFINHPVARLAIAIFWLLSVTLMSSSRWVFRSFLRALRRKGYNKRHVLIVGAGRLGQELAEKFDRHPEFGMHVVGYLTRKSEKIGKALVRAPVLGTYDQAPSIIDAYTIDQVFIAVPLEEYGRLHKTILFFRERTVDVRIVPDIHEFISLGGHAEIFDGLAIITLQGSPLFGWNSCTKRAIDLVFSLLILSVTSPLMVVIAVAIKLTSPGPVIYQQKRVGFDGRVFNMLKFRTMRRDAEDETGAVWAKKNDPRCTALGAFLRRTSLDELPQFFNVLKGEMSIVGPRPERPELVERFRSEIPKYMLRHKIKAGITGWAQVNGLRGNTSLAKRVEYDLHYIENWSPWMDLRIMWSTIFKGFINKNAY
jgi:Undecaprenyl-phosphate glucose phosphotransferase